MQRLNRVHFGPRISKWKTQPIPKNPPPMKLEQSGADSGQKSGFYNFAMIFGSIFGSFVAIALLQRAWPRRVEVVHRAPPDEREVYGGPYRSV